MIKIPKLDKILKSLHGTSNRRSPATGKGGAATNQKRPLTPVPPDGMEILFFYQCPHCGKHVPLASPTEARLAMCDGCRGQFPILPVDEHSLHFIRIMLANGKAAADPEYL